MSLAFALLLDASAAIPVETVAKTIEMSSSKCSYRPHDYSANEDHATREHFHDRYRRYLHWVAVIFDPDRHERYFSARECRAVSTQQGVSQRGMPE